MEAASFVPSSLPAEMPKEKQSEETKEDAEKEDTPEKINSSLSISSAIFVPSNLVPSATKQLETTKNQPQGTKQGV
jgi:hypothetical protein